MGNVQDLATVGNAKEIFAFISKNSVKVEHDGNFVKVFNATPHELTFGTADAELVRIPASGYMINSKVEEIDETDHGDHTTVTAIWTPNSEEVAQALSLATVLGIIVVGSLLAAQGYPKGHIKVVTPCKGFERVPNAEKRMNWNKFTVVGQ